MHEAGHDRGHDGEDDRDDEQDRGETSPTLVAVAAGAPPATQKVKRRKKSASSAIEPTRTATSRLNRMSKFRTSLVGEEALVLLPIELLEEARRDRHRGVIRVAPGGEGVGAVSSMM